MKCPVCGELNLGCPQCGDVWSHACSGCGLGLVGKDPLENDEALTAFLEAHPTSPWEKQLLKDIESRLRAKFKS